MVDLMLKRKHLQVVTQVRNYCSAKFSMTATFLFREKVTATFVPKQIGDGK